MWHPRRRRGAATPPASALCLQTYIGIGAGAATSAWTFRVMIKWIPHVSSSSRQGAQQDTWLPVRCSRGCPLCSSTLGVPAPLLQWWEERKLCLLSNLLLLVTW